MHLHMIVDPRLGHPCLLRRPHLVVLQKSTFRCPQPVWCGVPFRDPCPPGNSLIAEHDFVHTATKNKNTYYTTSRSSSVMFAPNQSKTKRHMHIWHLRTSPQPPLQAQIFKRQSHFDGTQLLIHAHQNPWTNRMHPTQLTPHSTRSYSRT